MAARIGVKGEFPAELEGWLFELAGGTRKYRPPYLDLHRTPFGPLPHELSGSYRLCLGHQSND
jgi:hypothetical protein